MRVFLEFSPSFNYTNNFMSVNTSNDKDCYSSRSFPGGFLRKLLAFFILHVYVWSKGYVQRHRQMCPSQKDTMVGTSVGNTSTFIMFLLQFSLINNYTRSISYPCYLPFKFHGSEIERSIFYSPKDSEKATRRFSHWNEYWLYKMSSARPVSFSLSISVINRLTTYRTAI